MAARNNEPLAEVSEGEEDEREGQDEEEGEEGGEEQVCVCVANN